MSLKLCVWSQSKYELNCIQCTDALILDLLIYWCVDAWYCWFIDLQIWWWNDDFIHCLIIDHWSLISGYWFSIIRYWLLTLGWICLLDILKLHVDVLIYRRSDLILLYIKKSPLDLLMILFDSMMKIQIHAMYLQSAFRLFMSNIRDESFWLSLELFFQSQSKDEMHYIFRRDHYQTSLVNWQVCAFTIALDVNDCTYHPNK